MKNKRKFVVFLYIYIVFFTSCLTMTTLAKYVGSANGSGTAQIARWSVNANFSSSSDISFRKTQETPTYTITVESISHVAADYEIIVSGLASGQKVSIDGGAYQTPINNTVTFTGYSFNATQSSINRTHTLRFSADIGASNVNNESIDIDVIFTQRNPGGV